MTETEAQVWGAAYAAVLASLAAVTQDGWPAIRDRARVEANAAVAEFRKA